MIPIGDAEESDRVPRVLCGLVLAMLAVWLFLQGAARGAAGDFLQWTCAMGVIPAQLLGTMPVDAPVPLGRGIFCRAGAFPPALTLVTSAFAHAGWAHLIANALGLWVFGNAMEDRLGARRFLALFVMSAIAAAGTHALLHPTSMAPTVGASGALAGVMGAYLRIAPMRRIRMLFVLFIVRMPAWIVLLYWFAFQLAGSLAYLRGGGRGAGSIAGWAHIGGFAFGFLAATWLARGASSAEQGVADGVDERVGGYRHQQVPAAPPVQ